MRDLPLKTYGPNWHAVPYDPAFCMEPVFSHRGSGGHQCNRKAIKDGYCTQHHPDAVIERHRKAAARHAAKDRQMTRLYAGPAIQALRSIASGHNDPARLARETLEKLGLEKETTG